MATDDMVRIAAVSDLHYGRTSAERIERIVREASREADVLLICGDLTDHGTTEQAEEFAELVSTHTTTPVLTVLGNHDCDSDQPDRVAETMEAHDIRVLDGDAVEIDGVGFAGVSGFAGGFDKRAVHPFGEKELKAFVERTVRETFKLEEALSRLDTERRVVLLHYAPLRTTVEGEPPEIYPFLGSSRLEAPLNHFDVTAAFHGHAHKGAPEGRTSAEIPVYNVAVPVLEQAYPDRTPYRLLELQR